MRLCGRHGLGHGYIKGRMVKAKVEANVGGIRCFDVVDKTNKYRKGDMG